MRSFQSSLALLAGFIATTTAVPTLPTEDRVKPKVILDNDWSPNTFGPYLMALDAGWDVLGLVSDTANTWARQTGLHALGTLELGGLECIPVHKGANYPLLNTPELFQAWQLVYGALPWQGAFARENLTNEALGNDPTSGDPERISEAALKAGTPKTAFASNDAAWFMVEQVRKYPGQISIYSAGALTNIALAVRMDATFARNCRELVIMGGYIDANLKQVTGDVMQADWHSDINLKIDPEASKIALTADFPNITIVGNAANSIPVTQEILDDINSVKNPYTELLYRALPPIFPFWDETAAAVMLDPTVVTESIEFYLDVDTSYASVTYGNIHAYQENLKPASQTLRKVKMVAAVDTERVYGSIKHGLQNPKTCNAQGQVVDKR